MTVSQKAAFSLLISVVLAAGFSILAFTGFFDLIETRFYNPSITHSLDQEIHRDAETIQYFLDELRDRFSASLESDAVKRSFLPNQAAQDIFERTRAYGILLESQRGLQSVRFVDAGGLRIHFSTSAVDIVTQTNETILYRNYDETAPYVPYADLAVPSGGNPKLTLDQRNERIVFSFPFYDSMEVYRGTVFFSLSIRAVTDRLIGEGRIKIGENFSIVSDPPGMVSGLPAAFNEAQSIIPVISSIWKENLFNLTSIDSMTSGSALALTSARTSQGLMVGRIIDESLFSFPQSMKVILLTAIFLTVFLSIFLAFNLQPDTMTIVQNRLKTLQLSLIREYYERKGEMDWDHWYRELEQRREDVRAELKRGVKETPALLEDIDSLIDKSWDEILTAIGGKRETRLAIDEDKLQNILNRMLLAAGTSPVLPGGAPAVVNAAAMMPLIKPASGAPAAASSSATDEEGILEELVDEEDEKQIGDTEVEELTEVEEVTDDVEEPEEIEELDDAEELSETEETNERLGYAGDSAEIEEIDEKPGDMEELAETEELPEAEEAAGAVEIPIILGASENDLVDDAVQIEELEELDDGLEDLEELPEEPETKTPSAGVSQAEMLSKIEFDDTGKPEEEAALDDDDDDFVVVSPFAGILSEFDDQDSFYADDDDSKNIKTSGRLEELTAGYSMSVVYKPFQNEDRSEPQELQAVSGVIKQKNGVSYVDKKAKTPDSETAKSLDPGLKNLVDSVIGKK
ncbi:MAG: hypothetical protein FWG27_05880 [Treponema sp.]|nr:hypothetical protein [Treponema sp.]